MNIIEIIGNVGFPIGVSIYLLARFEKKIETLERKIEKLEEAIQNLAKATRNQAGGE